jgi:hypothetical protein
MKTEVRLIVVGDIISPYTRSLRLKWYQAVILSVSVRLTLHGFTRPLTLGTFTKISQEIPNLVKIGNFTSRTEVRFIVTDDIKSS